MTLVKARVLFVLAVAAAVGNAPAQAYSTGITGRSGNPATGGLTCGGTCHSGGVYNYATATLTGSTSVAGSSVNAYTLNFNKAGVVTAAAAGFNLSATGGSLSDPNTGDSSVRKAGGELTHGTPLGPNVNGNFSWSFHWTAPTAAGDYKFYFCNNPVNLSGTNAGDGAIRCGNVTITVTPPPPTPPVANTDSYSTPPDTPLTVAAPGVLGNDTDANGDALTAAVMDDPVNGTLTLNADGSFTYTPDTPFTGTDTFTYQANDGSANSDPATVTITVAANAAPVANNNSYTTAEDDPLSVSAPGVLGNDTDADFDPLTAMVVNDPVNGTLTLSTNGSFIYTPDEGFTGSDSFTYQASDGLDNSNVATVTITVTPTPTSGGGGGGGGGGAPAPLMLALFALAALKKRDGSIFRGRETGGK